MYRGVNGGCVAGAAEGRAGPGGAHVAQEAARAVLQGQRLVRLLSYAGRQQILACPAH